MLKITRENRRDDFRSQNEITRLSRTTITVAAGGPNRIAAAKTNVSETESLAGMVGIRIVKEPLRRVNPARTNHWYPIDPVETLYSECRTTAVPAADTAPT